MSIPYKNPQMVITFPENAVVYQGSIRNISEREPTEIDILDPKSNIVVIDRVSYYYTYLGASAGNKGGNSIVLKLYVSQNIDSEEPEYGEPDLILKISKSKKSRFKNPSEQRFEKEINALKTCKEKSFQNVMSIYHSGDCKIYNIKGYFDTYYFYTMEYAKNDLKSYIEEKHQEITFDEKISLCLSLCEGLKELYTLGYYHRDIKPDNIFMIEDEWKIGDLGLLDERGKNNEIDKTAEFIGPRGWISPESMNKYLCEGKGYIFSHDHQIDHQSDIFQLGKVFWYIFQCNAPIGSVRESDFLIKDSRVYSILRTMVNHSKVKRQGHINDVIKSLKICEEKVLKQLVA